ncbi:MAG: hypothetical protein V5A88_05455 [Candidatus Thermoplasmatota archaeon]
MDLDFFVPGAHRLLFHNLFIGVVIPILIIIYLHRYYPKYREYGLIAFFYLVAHLILDLGVSIGLFYPIITDFYYFEAEMFFQFWGPVPVPDLALDYGVISAEDTQIVSENMTAGDTATQYASVSEISSGLFLTLVVAAVMYYEKSFTFLKEVWKLLIDIKDFVFQKIKSFLRR